MVRLSRLAVLGACIITVASSLEANHRGSLNCSILPRYAVELPRAMKNTTARAFFCCFYLNGYTLGFHPHT